MFDPATGKPIFRSVVNPSASRAFVFVGNDLYAHVFRDDGFWNVVRAGTTKHLLPRQPHTIFTRDAKGRVTDEREVPLGVVLKALRISLGIGRDARPKNETPKKAPAFVPSESDLIAVAA